MNNLPTSASNQAKLILSSRSHDKTLQQKRSSLSRRYLKEKCFRACGLLAIGLAFLSLILLLTDITRKALPALTQYSLRLAIPAELLTEGGQASESAQIIKNTLKQQYPELTTRAENKALRSILSLGAPFQLRDALESATLKDNVFSIDLLLDDDVDTYLKLNEAERKHSRLNATQIEIVEQMQAKGQIVRHLNWQLLMGSDSRNPEEAGIKGAITGTLLTILLTVSLSFPLGLLAAVYLEEFAPRNRLTDFIEININNLAAVPSIVFGLLGLAVFIGLFGLPRSAPLVGGLVLTLMTLPTIIISSRAALKAVPSSIKEAAIGLGASHMQTVFHHTVPFAMPGVLTGAIIGIAQAIGETAPLLMIGMVAFIVDVPHSLTDPATVLPVQIFLWADSPERAFVAKTSAAILLLLMCLMAINLSAVFLRRYFEKRVR